MRAHLHVPFDQKDQAKALGARWDADAKKWFVPDGIDPAPFAQWSAPAVPVRPAAPPPTLRILLSEEEAIYRAEAFALVTGTTPCWKCKHPTQVSAVIVREYEERQELDHILDLQLHSGLFTAIEALDRHSFDWIRQKAPWMRAGYTRTRDSVYLAAHCEACEAIQGSWFLEEPGAVFFPQTANDCRDLQVEWRQEPILLRGDPSSSSWHDWLLQR